MCYTTELQSAKLLALTALTDLLATTEDPIEKRRIATAILRTPDPKPERVTPNRATPTRATGSPGALTGQPVPSTPSFPPPLLRDPQRDHCAPLRAESHPDFLHLSKPTTQDLGTQDSSSSSHPTSDIPHPTFPPLSSLDARLEALNAELDHHLTNLLNSIPETTPPSSAPP